MDRSTNATADRGPERAPALPPELLTVKDGAAMLSVSPRHVKRGADAGWLPRPVSLSRSKRWVRSSILDWISRGCPRSRA